MSMLRSYRLSALFVVGVSLGACSAGPGGIDNWPITAADEQLLSGEIVDVLCDLSGNCAEDCGAGSRQLAIKDEQAGTVLVAKNLTTYTGAVDELSQFCGDVVEINGLFTTHAGVRIFQVQNFREPGGSWKKAREYSQAWAARSGQPVSRARKWYFSDERVDAILEADGRLGLGPEADEEYFK